MNFDRALNLFRWFVLSLSPALGFAACFVKTRHTSEVMAWGFPFPIAIFEKTEHGWIDFPVAISYLLNPMAFFLPALLVFWGIGMVRRRYCGHADSE